MDIDGKVFLITGASSGIGAATARAASAAGARLVLAARRLERIEALAAELGDAVAVRTDVTDPAQVHAAVRAGVDTHGRIDVLVNNAGQGLHSPLEEVDPDDFRAVLDLNVVAPLVALQAVLSVMRAQGGGSVVDVSSGTSRTVLPGVGAYAASKSALNALSAVARRELAPDGIVVSTVYPFITATEFHDVLRAGSLRRRPGGPPPHTPEQVAEAILGLVRSGEEEAVLVPEGFGPPAP
ncbi:SDR family oxidoreductase [Kineococcus sp. SYSU DK005]|uniref:SDR family oxidoreductase n=1 Tax=Kineococcus sp. SYSU DK005 TaxID=3383126 RepID=UPI003D7E26FA